MAIELTDSLIDEIASAVGIGATLETAAGYAGVPATLVRYWLRIGEAENRQLERGQAEQQDKAIYLRLLREIKQAEANSEINLLNTVDRAAQSDPGLALKLLEYRKRVTVESDDPFGASLNLPGQVESREAYKLLEATATQGPWWDDYLALRRERTAEGKQRWNWREAVYIAWASLPKRLRWPETQEELARQVLGLTNDRTIREWKLKRPEIQERIVQLTGDVAMKHRAEVLDALVQVATMADPKAHPDRRLFMEWAGIYKPGQRLEHSGPDGGPIEIMEMSGLTDEQLARIAAGEDPRQVIQW